MHDFVLALIGGAMIGLAAVILMGAQGRVMGVSGIVSHLLPSFDSAREPAQTDERSWRLLFMAGVIAAPLLSIAILGYRPPVTLNADPVLLIISGLIVGVGTVFGNGCTSGHGVCGLARLSGRSMAATAIFMATAIATVFIANTVAGG
ncbi:MAG: YeeE/YedE thiosulfate transporter family protein [Pseudomonadota bacterium]